MDRQAILDALKKYHFWVLLGVVLIGTPAVWYLAKSAMAGDTEKEVRTIDGKFDGLAGIGREQTHPNQDYLDNTKKRIEDQKEKVLAAWKKLYQKQGQENRLPTTLTKGFKDAFESGGRLAGPNRDEYQRFVLDHIDKLFYKDLRVRRLVVAEEAKQPDSDNRTHPAAADMFFGATEEDDEGEEPQEGDPSKQYEGVVDWETRGEVRKLFEWNKRQSNTRVRLAQEDLWVFEALINVIIRTNELETGAPPATNEEAAVREIKVIEIGQALPGDMETSSRGYRAADEEDDSHDALVGSSSSAGSPETEEAESQPAMDPEKTALLTNRYVGENGESLAAGEDDGFVQYNIMKVRMELVVHQSKIPKLLAECANSSMPIEVRSFSIRPGQGEAYQVAIPDQKSGAGSRRRPHRGPTVFHGSSGKTDAARVPASVYVPIEIEGTICIYERPQRDLLGMEDAGDTDAEDTAPTDTPPADTPPADTPPADTPPVDTGTPPADTTPTDTAPTDTPPTDTIPSGTGG